LFIHLNGLRDKTLSEIKKDALKEITCPCRNRKYCVKNESIIRHFETNAHKEWVEIQKKRTINYQNNKPVNYFDNLDINNNPIHMDSFTPFLI
jgi:hypothetical protein